jgi:hypothetical protein
LPSRSTSPMHTPLLRARSAGEILDAAFQFMRAEYSALVLGTGILLVPTILLEALFPSLAFLWTIIGRLMYLAASSIPVVMVTDYYVGRPVDVGGAIRTVMRRFWSIWGAAFMSGLITLFGLVLLIVPGVIAFARLFAMPSVVLAEGATASDSYQRSVDLTRDSMGHILATLGVAYLIFWVVGIGMSMAADFGGALIGMPPAGGAFLAETLMIGLYPFVGVVSALLYIDLRVRKEALDVQLMAAALGETPAPVLAG